MILPTLLLLAATSAPVASTSCHRCEMPRPITPSRQWEIDHSFAHHLAEVIARTAAPAPRWREILDELRSEARAARLTGDAREIVDECVRTIEALILYIERTKP